MKDRVIDSHTIQQYFKGSLDVGKMHELEKQALNDEFLSDALEGYTYVIEPAEKLSILQQQLADRILVQESNKKAFSITSHRLSIAAASGLMFILAVILFWMNGYKGSSDTKRVEVNLSPAPLHAKENGNITAEQISSASQPVVGWEKYRSYIQNNIRKPDAALGSAVKNVIIAFKINSSGSPVDLKVAGGIYNSYSAEAIRVIKSGPRWKSADEKEVRVRINFDR